MGTLIVRNGTVFDGRSTTGPSDIVIVDGLISDVRANAASSYRDARVIDADGAFVMPGFIDAHTHLALAPVPERKGDHPSAFFTAVRQARIKLASGVTTVRDVGGINHIDIELKKAIRRGDVFGPRMLTAGRFLAPTGGHVHYFSEEVDGADNVRRAAREQLKAGADLIKIMVSGGASNLSEPPERLYMREDEIAAAVYEAHAAGRKVAAHVHPARGIALCARQGVNTIEHGAWIDDEAIDAMLAAGTSLIPTHAVYHYMANASDPRYAELAPVAHAITIEKSERLRHAIDRGIRIGVGTDCGRHFPYDAYVDELQQLCRVGMSEEDVLRAATAVNAEILGIGDKVGTLEPGKAGDAIVIDGNPLDDISHAGKVRTVIQGGVVLEPATLLAHGVVH
ncbi:MAG: amidohydrolase family protein [Rhizobiaceae bacterium]|nr:amidohydrolase family protein [Rhizobiaceae bacterium]